MTKNNFTEMLDSSTKTPPSITRWVRNWSLEQSEEVSKLITHTFEVEKGIFPYDCKFKITHRCNADCKMCLHPIKLRTDETLHTQELSDYEIRKIIPELAETGCRSIHFSGGEPLLRKKLEVFIKDAAKNGIRSKLTTNGTLLSEKRANNLAKAKLRSVNISLDGPTSEVHDSMRGVKGFFNKAISGIQAISEARETYGRPHVRINSVVSHENAKTLDQLLELAKELKIDSLHILPVDFSHIDPSLALTDEDYEIVKEVLSNYKHETRLLGDVERLIDLLAAPETREFIKKGEYAFGYYRESPCFAPFVHLFMMPEGKVYTCCIVDRTEANILGNVRKNSIQEIWANDNFKELRKKAVKNTLYSVCHSCDHFLEINQIISEKTGFRTFEWD
ncbi:MAG: radical SAM protein [Candidatus Heimdallarchaeota archaeon]|nr:radical SAM protein [Candidatus Heimdallarchaeota archaeon]MCK5049065.1 radical SAM protein [Candidatus Heimdallarchaeota archaeon]